MHRNCFSMEMYDEVMKKLLVALGQQAVANLIALSLLLLRRAGGENKMKYLMSQDKYRKTTQQLLSQAK